MYGELYMRMKLEIITIEKVRLDLGYWKALEAMHSHSAGP